MFSVQSKYSKKTKIYRCWVSSSPIKRAKHETCKYNVNHHGWAHHQDENQIQFFQCRKDQWIHLTTDVKFSHGQKGFRTVFWEVPWYSRDLLTAIEDIVIFLNYLQQCYRDRNQGARMQLLVMCMGCSSSHTLVCVCAFLGDRAVSRGSSGPIGTYVVRNRRVSPYLVSGVAIPYDDMREQARSVNLLETWRLVSRRGHWGNPLANGQNSSW